MKNTHLDSKKDDLKRQASNGAFWGLSSNLIVSAISFVGTAVLARLLSPKDFGLIGMSTLIIGIVQLFGNLGLGAKLIQKRDIDDGYLSTAFWSSLLVSVGLTVVAITISPVAASFFNEPIIKWIIIFLSVTFIFSSFSSIHRTILYKEIKMKKIASIEILGRFGRMIVMLISALAGMGFWSIAIGMIFEVILKSCLFIITAHWVPVFHFDLKKLKELFAFGKHFYGLNFLEYLSSNMDFIITGRLLGVKLLGFYQFSYNVPYLVRGYIQDGLAPIAFPVFSKVNHDTERLSRGLLNAVKYVSMMTFPLMFGLAFCANDFIVVVYSDKWLPAVQPLRILCLAAAMGSVHCIVGHVFGAIGRPDIGFKWGVTKLTITIISILMLSRWSIIGVAWAMFLVEFLTISTAYIATKLIKTGFTKYLSALMPAFCGSLIMLIFLFFINQRMFIDANVFLRLASNIAIGAIVYIIALSSIYRRDFTDAIEFIKLSLKRKETAQVVLS